MLKISVVIPTHNRPQLLVRCLDALRMQSLPDNEFEIIVVTDGPDAATSAMVNERYRRSNIRVLQTSIKAGPAAARNHGWLNSRSQLVAFTDDDTIPDKDWLQEFINAYNGDQEIAFTGRTIVPLTDEPTDYEMNTFGLEQAEFITANCCCSRAALERVNGFDERFSMAWREDSDLHFRLLNAGLPIRRVSAAIVVHPVRTASWGISIREQKKGIYNALLYKKHPALYRQRIQQAPLWNYYAMCAAALLVIVGLLIPESSLSVSGFLVWLFLYVDFARRRLANTSKSPRHISEMLLTSACIPFISVYWQFYGGLKFKTLLL